jgi:hypothetical protein
MNPEIREVAYQPAIDTSKITVSYVISKLENLGQTVPFEKETEQLRKINKIVDSFYEDIHNSPENTLLKEI